MFSLGISIDKKHHALITQLHFSKVISLHMTEQVMWKVPVWRLTFQLPQQTVIVRTASQGYLPSAQVSKLVT